MEPFFQYIIPGGLALLMWLIKRTVDSNEADVKDLKVQMQVLRDTRVHRDDFKDFKIELREQFEEIKQAIRDVKFTNG